MLYSNNGTMRIETDEEFDQRALEWVRKRIEQKEDYYSQIVLKQRQEYYQKNKDKIRDRLKQYRQEHKQERNEYVKNKYKTDINYKLSELLRNRVRKAIKSYKRPGSAVKDLGCTVQELKDHLELQFKPGMTWDNHGQWHIDHIKPLSIFDLSDPEQFMEACHYSNLQPLWAKDNLSKSNKVPKEPNELEKQLWN
tara:strand:+ start:175 stop:759 length:585 start_codon:yes stop_codon:yes gene_type:complete